MHGLPSSGAFGAALATVSVPRRALLSFQDFPHPSPQSFLVDLGFYGVRRIVGLHHRWATCVRDVRGGVLHGIDARRRARAIVLVLGASGDGPKNTSLSLDDLIGKRLTATQEGAQEEFLLKPTGFFVWTQREANGTRIEKTGRYSLDGEALHLDFRVTTTRPGSPPDIQVEQGRRENHQLKLDGGALLLGDKRFEP